MFKLLPTASVLLACVFSVVSQTTKAQSFPHEVYVRVEGSFATFFENLVLFPYPRNISTPSSNGSYPCDGTNGGANPTPGPTLTTALAQAIRHRSKTGNSLYFDARYDSAIEDFHITTIGTDREEHDDFWAPYLNFQVAQAGGCEVEINRRDQVLWVFMTSSSFGPALKLQGTRRAIAGKPFKLKVLDGGTGMAFQGAVVGPAGPVLGVGSGPTSDENGDVTITEPSSGVFSYKARPTNGIRSNQHVVTVR